MNVLSLPSCKHVEPVLLLSPQVFLGEACVRIFAQDASVKEFDSCIAKLKSAIAELEKGKTYLNQMVTALKKVQDAASKTAAELSKLARTKNVDGSSLRQPQAELARLAALRLMLCRNSVRNSWPKNNKTPVVSHEGFGKSRR